MVDLPQPLCPTMATVCPGGTCNRPRGGGGDGGDHDGREGDDENVNDDGNRLCRQLMTMMKYYYTIIARDNGRNFHGRLSESERSTHAEDRHERSTAEIPTAFVEGAEMSPIQCKA